MRHIVTILGTSRPGNYTGKALAVVQDELQKEDLTLTLIDTGKITLPFPGLGDTEDALWLRDTVHGASGLVIATPEYHGGLSAMTKLVIENLGFPSALRDKPVALLGVAAGRIGAVKSLEQLRGICAHVGGIVLPMAVSVAGVQGAFDEEGNCTNVGVEKNLRELASSLLTFLENYVCPKYALEAIVREEGGKPWSSSV